MSALGARSSRARRGARGRRACRAAPAPPNECNGIPRCIPVAGPWVVVPAHGEAQFLLSARGAAASSPASTRSRARRTSARPSTAILGEPGRVRAHDRHATRSSAPSRRTTGAGYFKPFIGCIPAPTSCREHDRDARSTPLGAAARPRGGDA